MMKEAAKEKQWVLCPWCGAKTRLQIFRETELKAFLLFCPKCRRESIIDIKKLYHQYQTARRQDAELIAKPITRCVLFFESDPSASAVPAAVKLLDWGVNTGLDTEEIGDAASEWLGTKDGEGNDLLNKLKLVDDAYQKLLTAEARELLDGAGREEVEITWGSDPVEPVEAIMQAAGLRG